MRAGGETASAADRAQERRRDLSGGVGVGDFPYPPSPWACSQDRGGVTEDVWPLWRSPPFPILQRANRGQCGQKTPLF